jgi:2-dehydropantoate 2-reductase
VVPTTTKSNLRVAVVGLGAVGGLLAVRLARAGHAVSALARGATLAALQARGVRLREGAVVREAAVRAADDARALGEHDLVIASVKGPALPALAPQIAVLAGREGIVLQAMNGVPWWFMSAWHDRPAHLPATLASVDPQGATAAAVPLSRVLGCVVHLSASSPAAGESHLGFGNKLIVGAPTPATAAQVAPVAAALRGAAFTVEESDDIRRDIWFKLWGNMTTNPVSALTGATSDRILDDPFVRAFCLRAMAEAAAVGERIGCPIAQSSEERMAVTRQLGAFKTSMLQDAQAGRPLEVDALVGAVVEIAQAAGVATPNIEALFGLVRLMDACRAGDR